MASSSTAWSERCRRTSCRASSIATSRSDFREYHEPACGPAFSLFVLCCSFFEFLSHEQRRTDNDADSFFVLRSSLFEVITHEQRRTNNEQRCSPISIP